MAPAIAVSPCKAGAFFRAAISCRGMAIYRRLRNTSLAETGHLIAAYELTLRALDLTDRNDPLTLLQRRFWKSQLMVSMTRPRYRSAP